jgi:hypothetical protein
MGKEKPLFPDEDLEELCEDVSEEGLFCVFCGKPIKWQWGEEYVCRNPECYSHFKSTKKW